MYHPVNYYNDSCCFDNPNIIDFNCKSDISS